MSHSFAAATDMAGAAQSGWKNEIPREIIMAAERPDFPRREGIFTP
jgi:hypothetical protein